MHASLYTRPTGLGESRGAKSSRVVTKVVDGVYTRWFGNEDECAWLGLNQATDEALPEYDHQGQTDIIDGDKGGRKANECRKFKIFADYHHRLENVKANCGAVGG